MKSAYFTTFVFDERSPARQCLQAAIRRSSRRNAVCSQLSACRRGLLLCNKDILLRTAVRSVTMFAEKHHDLSPETSRCFPETSRPFPRNLPSLPVPPPYRPAVRAGRLVSEAGRALCCRAKSAYVAGFCGAIRHKIDRSACLSTFFFQENRFFCPFYFVYRAVMLFFAVTTLRRQNH